MVLNFLKLNTKKAISILCAIFILAATLPLNALLLPTKAAEAGNLIDFEGKNAESIVNGNDAFSLAGQDKEDKYYLYAKNNTANTLTLNFDSIELKTDKKYTLDFDVYTLRMSKDEGNALLGLKLYGKDKTSLNATITNMDVCEEEWANYHTTFVAKEKNNKLDFSLFTFGKVFIDNLVLIDENGKETALDFAKACEKTEHPDHFSSSTLYDIAYDEVDVVDGYLKAVVPENSNTIHNEGVDIPFNIGKNIEAGRYTVKLDVKFTAVGSCRNSFCVSVAGMGVDIQQKWIDAVDVTLNKYETFSFDFDLTPEFTYFRFNVYQGCTAYIDNVYLIDAAGTEVVKFDFDSPVNFRGAFYEQKGIPRNRAASAALYSRLMRSSNVSDYAIYFESGAQNNFWVTKKDASHPELGMEELNLSADKTYTVDFDVYALTAGSNVVFGGTKATWDTTAAINGNDGSHQLWKSAPTALNTWTHYSFNVTTVAEWKGLIFYVVGSGFKGYIDNLTIKEGNNVVASFNPTDTTLTSNCASIVDLPVDVANAKPEEKSGDYAIYFESGTQNNFWVTKKDASHPELGMEELNLSADKTYTVDFDVYALTAGSNIVFGGTKATWDTTAAINGNDGSHQLWKSAPTTLNTWTHYSFNVTTVAEWKGLIFYVVGSGFKGYIDNLTIKDGNNVVASFNPTDTTLTSNCASIVDLPVDVANAKPEEKSGDYAIYFESGTQNNFWVTKKDASHPELGMEELNLSADKTYTVDFDVYALTAGSNIVFGGTTATWDTTAAINGNDGSHQLWKSAPTTLNTWTHYSFNVTTVAEWKGLIFYVLNSGFKGYIDNLTIKEGDSVVASFNPTDTTLTSNCASIVDLPVSVANAKDNNLNPDDTPGDGNVKLFVDTTSVSDNGSAKNFWFNELGMASYYNKLVSGETYKVVFDVYPEKMPAGNNLFTFETANGQENGSTRAGYWGKDLQEGKWQTTSTTFKVEDGAKSGNHVLYVYGGFKGYIDNFKIVDKDGNTVEGTATDFSGLTIPDKHKDYLELTDVKVTDKTPSEEPSLSGMKITVLRGRAGKDGASIKLGGANSPLTLKSNTSYRLSFRYYQANPTNTGVLNLFGINTGFDNDIAYFKKNNTEGWANGTVYFTTGEVTDTTADWLELILNPNAWVYFDNFKIVEQEPDNNKPVSIIKFDKADDTIYPSATVEKATFAYSNEHGGTFKAVNATEYTNTDKNSNRTYTFKGIKMKPNTTYRVSIDYYVAAPFTDYAAAFGYNQSALGIGTGASWPCYIDNETVKGWHTASFTVTTGDVVPNGNYINLAFYDVENTNEPRVMHFDNLSFTELYKVETSVNDTTLGTVTKTKTLEAGESVKVTANAFAGAKFEGWYEYGDLVSTDKYYHIKNIDDNHKLVAKFSGETKPAKTIVQSFEDYDLGDIDFPWYEIVNDSKNVLHGNQSLHIKPDKITESVEASIFFPVVSNVKYQLKDDYSYDFYVWVKPAKTPKSVAYYAIVNSMSRDLSDMVYSGELSGTSMSLNIKPQAADALEEKDGWFKYRLGTITKKNASMEGYAFQICKFHANRGEGASIDDLYIDRVEVVERTPDFANLKYTEKFFNEITNSNFEEKVTEENWAPLTDGVTVEKVTEKEYDWQGKYNLKFDAAKSNGQEYVRVIPISKLSKNYTFAAWTKLSKGSDITVGLYKNGRYEKFENIVNGQKGTLPMIDDGKWNRVSFTFNSGDSSDAYLVIKGTKGTLYLDMVEMFIAERGYLKDPNRYGDDKTGFDLFDPIAFPDEVITNVTYVDTVVDDVVEEELLEQEEPTEETEDKKPTKKKYKVVRKRKNNDAMTRLWVGIGAGVVLLAVGVVISIIFFKKRKNVIKEVK